MAGNIDGIEGLQPVVLASEQAVSVARVFPPTTEIKVSPGGIACEDPQGGDRITFDLGATQVGTYTVVKNYPFKTSLSPTQARAHICPKRPEGQEQPPCYNFVQSGQVVITKYDGAAMGHIDGSYLITLDEGTTLTGTFSAFRCN